MTERKPKTAAQALSALMRLCSRAEKSSGDALRLMRGWQVPEGERAGVLATLLEQRFIDDSRYAAAYVREKSRLSGWGILKIRRQLALKGVARGVIEGALRENMPARGGSDGYAGGVNGDGSGSYGDTGGSDDGASESKLLQMLRRKKNAIRESDPFKLRAKLFRYGISLGHPYDDVIQAIEELSDFCE